MSFDGQKLFDLMPALYRLRDAQIAQSQNLLTPAETAQLATLQATPPPLTVVQQQQLDRLLAKAARGPLQSLLAVITEQLAAMENDLGQLYDDQFIETCAKWVIPYIGDLIGYQSVKGVAPAVASPRAEVAHTIGFRRRKGTALMLEQLARDVTGWGAHAVEFFLRLADTQYVNHIRPHNFYAPNLRRWEPRVYQDHGFDETAHTVDVRRIAVERGRYNIQNIGVFLWSLNPYSLTMSPLAAVAGASNCFRFSPLGRDIALFTTPIYQGADITTAAEPFNVPDRLRRHVLCRDIEEIQKGAAGVYYGLQKSLIIYVDGAPKSKIQVCNLSGPDGAWINLPLAGSAYDAAIDPELGRLALPSAGASPKVQATFYYGFNADMGGGEYPRATSFAASPEQPVVRVPGDYADIQTAIDALSGDGVVEITDSGVHAAAGLNVNVSANSLIELRAHDESRPVLVLSGEMTVTGGKDSAFYLNGIVVTSAVAPASPTPSTLIRVPAKLASGASNELGTFGLNHCTLVPGWALASDGTPKCGAEPTLIVASPGTQLEVKKSILGAMRADGLAVVSVCDSIIDATDATAVAYASPDGVAGGGALTLQGCTAIGTIHATLLSLVSDSIVWAGLTSGDTRPAPLWADRKQEGCIRFTYIPAGSIVPRQFKCVVEGWGTNFAGWTASTSVVAGQLIYATVSGANYVYRCALGGTTGVAAPSFPASEGSVIIDNTAVWQNVGAPGITPGPLFESLRYGDCGYAKLLAQTDDSVRRGAHDGGEMGAFHFVLAPLRETDLRVRLQEYMPVGLEFGIFYET